MPYYLVQAVYAPAAMSSLIQSPQDRWQLLRSMASRVGGRIENLWLAFGEHDLIAVLQMPDPQTMAALSMALCAGGGLKQIKTTVMLTPEEAIHAGQLAANVGHRPPHPETE